MTPIEQQALALITEADREAAASIAVLVEMRDLILAGKADHHAAAFARHRIAAEAAEQARIVAWIRTKAIRLWGADTSGRDETQFISDAIERKEHLK